MSRQKFYSTSSGDTLASANRSLGTTMKTAVATYYQPRHGDGADVLGGAVFLGVVVVASRK